jgi:hypothetical protein
MPAVLSAAGPFLDMATRGITGGTIVAVTIVATADTWVIAELQPEAGALIPGEDSRQSHRATIAPSAPDAALPHYD